MNMNKFRQVNTALAARFGMQTIVILVLALIIFMQQWHINTREEIVIDRPMFQQDRAMKMVRGRATQDVREVWAWNLSMLYGNMNTSNIGHVRGVTYSMLSPNVREQLDKSHLEQVRMMEQQRIDISFHPDGLIRYDSATGWVSISGHREVRSLVNPDAQSNRVPYIYRVLISVEGFRPWVTGWQEGEVK